MATLFAHTKKIKIASLMTLSVIVNPESSALERGMSFNDSAEPCPHEDDVAHDVEISLPDNQTADVPSNAQQIGNYDGTFRAWK